MNGMEYSNWLNVNGYCGYVIVTFIDSKLSVIMHSFNALIYRN